jgi:hypothetical protein
MPFGIPKGAMCVQRFDDSLNSAIHITYRISLRSSSMPEPRDPLLKVLFNLFKLRRKDAVFRRPPGAPGDEVVGRVAPEATSLVHKGLEVGREPSLSNDPSAGSPTETLLRLLLPLNDRV